MEIVRIRLIEKEESSGCEKAPVEILKSFKEIECKENGERIDKEKIKFEEIHIDIDNKEEANFIIYENSKELLEKNPRTFFIGGDNSINYSLFKAFIKTQKNPLILVFDAHCGCFNSDLMNRNWMRKLIDEGFGKKIIFIGCRSFKENELELLKKNNIQLISLEILGEDLSGICDLLMERARNSSGFFVNIDLDVLDPGFAPGVNITEPGGMSSRDILYLVKRLKILENFRGGCIIGINPDKDINNITIKLGVRLLAEMI